MLNLRLKTIPRFFFSVWEKLVNSVCKPNYNCPFMQAGFFPTVLSKSIACYQFPSKHCCAEDIVL